MANPQQPCRKRLSLRIRAASLLPLLLVAVGCYIPLSKVDPTARFDEGDKDAVVVFALAPSVSLFLRLGIDDGVNWSCQRLQMVRVQPVDGYVVVKLKPRLGQRKYAIQEISADGLRLELYGPQTNVKLPAFNAVPGQVTFLGGLIVKSSATGNSVLLREDDSATRVQAATFMKQHYPQISAPVVSGHFDWIYMTDDCP